MTNNQLTKEWLQGRIANMECYGVVGDEALILQAYRMALAAMDSEPVIIVGDDIGDALSYRRLLQTFAPGTKLYRHAQPAPVVPTFDEWLELRGNKPLGWVKDAMRESYDACRAAMLQAEPVTTANKLGNSPAIPDTWIPVSERIPEDEQEVLTINRMGHRFVSFFDKHSGLFFDRLDAPAACCIEHVLVTHWMPLPNPPKEVK